MGAGLVGTRCYCIPVWGVRAEWGQCEAHIQLLSVGWSSTKHCLVPNGPHTEGNVPYGGMVPCQKRAPKPGVPNWMGGFVLDSDCRNFPSGY